MKKHLAIAALAAATFAAPLALAPEAAAQHRGDRHDRYDRDDRRGDRYDRRENRREARDDRRNYNRGYRDGRRDDRRADRWDNRRYNGYHYQGRWYYGPPPRHYRDVRYDYRQWRRGDRLPGYYRDHYRVVDYRHYRHLRAPPRGYHYVRDDRGDYLLVGIATGVILGIIASQ
ncbi:MAG TPA: RcnB family protein [Terricaulis sp.]|nr:RcnB family protein [Terricaulis sp.]HRP12223.1 RcnB family protein [Terricaulis sp.]